MHQPRPSLVIAALALAACGAPSDDPDVTLVTAADVQPFLDELETRLAKVTEMPVASAQHGAADTVDVWVTPSVSDDYLTLSVDEPSSDVVFPEDTVLVKEQYDDEGAFDSYTVMVKGPPGQDADVGDWWFGYAGSDGEVSAGPSACAGCHMARPDSDYVYGL